MLPLVGGVTDLSAIHTLDLWEPLVLGRNKLDEVWWAYLVKVPFDMPADVPASIGSRVTLDGQAFRIGGSVLNVPATSIRTGDSIQILVREL